MVNAFRSVMIDNWTMSQLVSDWKRRSKVPLQYHELLSAIVLWDEVLYPDNGFAQWKEENNPFSAALTCVETNDRPFLLEARKKIDILHKSQSVEQRTDDSTHLDWIQNNIIKINRNLIEESTMSYWLYCQDQSCDYLPAPDRREYMKRFMSSRENPLQYFRLDVIRQFDKTWAERIEEILRILGDNTRRIEFPLLSHFIIRNREEKCPLIISALHMSCEGAFVRFREFLDEIDRAINEDDINQVLYLTKNIRDATNEIFKLDRDNITSVDVGLFPNPGITIGAELRMPRRRSGLSMLYDIGQFTKSLKTIKPYSDKEYWDFLGEEDEGEIHR